MSREQLYLRYLIEKGAVDRHGPFWGEDPRRAERIEHELEVINKLGFASFFIILADIMDFCREESIPYGPGRGSVGGSYVAYLIGITEVDSIEWDLTFARFLTENRVGLPDVDIDVSQRQRQRVIDYVVETYGQRGYAVLQVVALGRMGGRGTIDAVAAAKRETDPSADQVAFSLKRCLPEGNITAGTKQERELHWWLTSGQGHGDKETFKQIAEASGWYDPMMKLDGCYTNQARHAAGVVILDEDDIANIPRVGVKDTDTGEFVEMTGFDMYDLDALKYMKYDFLGLRTLDVIADAHRFLGGSGNTRDLMEIWKNHRDDPDPYPMLTEGDTLGIFQMETTGYRRTLRDFEPNKFDHIVALNALYRPGALDYRREDGKNMVEVFIERRHGNEAATPPTPKLEETLRDTYGIFLYQEQSMKAAQVLAGFDDSQADTLRKAIGKKQQKVMDSLIPLFREGCIANGIPEAVVDRVWKNIAAAARYSWNKAHAVEYAAITWLTAWFKCDHPHPHTCEIEGCPCTATGGKAAFFAALLNSYEKDKDKQASVIAEARQSVEVSPPDINVAEDTYVADGERIVFGLNGLKGMGPANRGEILRERLFGPYTSFEDFCTRLPSCPISMKKMLIQAGAFDEIEDREYLMSLVHKGKPKLELCPDCENVSELDGDVCLRCEGTGEIEVYKTWTVAEHLNHNRNLKTPRPVPEIQSRPTAKELGDGEMKAIGFYVSSDPLADVSRALARCPKSNHWGGEIEAIYRKRDKRGMDMATITITTTSLAKQRVVVFGSNWPQNRWVEKGDRIIIRGRQSGEDVIAESIFKPDEVRHFKKLKVSRNGDDPTIEDFDGQLSTVEGLEAAGYKVGLL